MTEQRLKFIDIEPKSSSSTGAEGTAKKPRWTRSDNSFRFNFFTDDFPRPQEDSASSDRNQPAAGLIAFTGQDSAFAFNFQIPPVPPEEDMKMMETSDTREEKPHPQQVMSSSEPSEASSKAKKKKKSGKKKASESKEAEKVPISTEESRGDEELSAEQQLNRQLDWCIEQLELVMRSQKGTPKQKEEASHALKTLRSSKAPLAKKRQVMRAMTGDYRKKMEEEKSKQFKLIKSEIGSAQVKAVSDSPQKSVFHRRAEVKSQTPTTEKTDMQKTEACNAEMTAPTQETSAFVFTPSKEEFRFNFL